MKITRLETGTRMSQSVICGEFVYLAGQVGAGADIREQTHDALAEVERLLELSGSDKSHILSTTIWLATMDDFDGMNEVWDAWIDPKNPPARACGEARLAAADYLVEFIVNAVRKG